MSGSVAGAGRMMARTAIVLVTVAVAFVVIGGVSQAYGFAMFGAILGGIGVVLGIGGYVAAMSRR